MELPRAGYAHWMDERVSPYGPPRSAAPIWILTKRGGDYCFPCTFATTSCYRDGKFLPPRLLKHAEDGNDG